MQKKGPILVTCCRDEILLKIDIFYPNMCHALVKDIKTFKI
jgi:hypothetical protein